jgi:hypothetical protein
VSELSQDQLREKVLESLEAAIACCDAVPHLPGLRRPPARIPIPSLFSDFNHTDAETFDFVVGGFPWGLPSADLIQMVWYSIPASSVSFSALQIGPRTLFFELNDNDDDCPHFLAVADGISIDLAEETFMRELFGSNGETFSTPLFGGSPPNEVASRFPRPILAECFLAAADKAVEYGDFWEELCEIVAKRSRDGNGPPLDASTKAGRSKAIEAYFSAIS